MLAVRNRFHGHGSLRYVYRNGSTLRREHLMLKYISNKRRQEPRVSIVVSKKVHKGAVGRNRIRRRLYESIRQELGSVVPGSDIVVIVTSPELITMPGDTVRHKMRALLVEAGLYKTTP